MLPKASPEPEGNRDKGVSIIPCIAGEALVCGVSGFSVFITGTTQSLFYYIYNKIRGASLQVGHF